MKFQTLSTLLLWIACKSHACPFNKSNSNTAPDDENHKNLRSRKRILSSLTEDETTRAKIAEIIQNRSRQQNQSNNTPKSNPRSRSVQETCLSTSVYNDIIDDISSTGNAISNLRDRGHFFGGIVRLAAHDFMDFDINADGTTSQQLGPDGCIDFNHDANRGLPDLWCDPNQDKPDGCPLKIMYDTNYSFMSKADFWVAAANAVIKTTSTGVNTQTHPNGLELPFRWGRVDNVVCDESSGRLPEPHGCSEVEATFLNRMGLSWTDAVALMGAHTLGRGHTEFSGHDGTWVDTDQESTIFDKRFYEEVLRRSWRPRQTDAGINWTWGGQNLNVMMLHTDICLFFDIPEDEDPTCCTDTDGNCRDAVGQCPTAEAIRPEAFNAFNQFLGNGNNIGNNDQTPFYTAFTEAWVKATENGYSNDELFDLSENCGPTPAPIPSTPQPNPSPVISPPTTPVTSSPVGDCADKESFEVIKYDGTVKTRTCASVEQDECTKFGHHCRVTCDVCECLTAKMRCSNDSECCSGKCNDKGKCKS